VESIRFVSAIRLAQLIREKKIGARETVEAFIAHIERVNPTRRIPVRRGAPRGR
jgi:hypothetical protein